MVNSEVIISVIVDHVVISSRAFTNVGEVEAAETRRVPSINATKIFLDIPGDLFFVRIIEKVSKVAKIGSPTLIRAFKSIQPTLLYRILFGNKKNLSLFFPL